MTTNLTQALQQKIQSFEKKVLQEEVGEVVETGDGIAQIKGLGNVMNHEMVELGSNSLGLALNLKKDRVGIIILNNCEEIKQGDTVKRTGKLLSMPVSEELMGRVINPLGEPLDGKGKIKAEKRYPIEKIAPGVIERQSVNTPLQTGIRAIDSMIPIGRGQRELIIGDRQTGKTALLIDTIINQKNKDVICIYVAIGQKESKAAKIIADLEKAGALEHTIVVLTSASSPAAQTYIAPYAGSAIAEYFMEQGKDVLICYDDLSKHAWAYRQISLLLRRPPGREAYPGDIFYLHSRLLERACKLDEKRGGGSITALPVIETQSGDISSYIPTNVISITDGQIYLESDLFYQGVRPALNVGLSVSRVGSNAQIKAMKQVAGKLRLDLAQYRELAAFAQFGSDLDEATRKQIERGERLTEILKQGQFEPQDVILQVMLIFAAVHGYLDDIAVEKIQDWQKGFYEYLETNGAELVKKLNNEKEITESADKQIRKLIENYKKIAQK